MIERIISIIGSAEHVRISISEDELCKVVLFDFGKQCFTIIQNKSKCLIVLENELFETKYTFLDNVFELLNESKVNFS
jgi:hypothetical protein